jgi:hypothetical protein
MYVGRSNTQNDACYVRQRSEERNRITLLQTLDMVDTLTILRKLAGIASSLQHSFSRLLQEGGVLVEG